MPPSLVSPADGVYWRYSARGVCAIRAREDQELMRKQRSNASRLRRFPARGRIAGTTPQSYPRRLRRLGFRNAGGGELLGIEGGYGPRVNASSIDHGSCCSCAATCASGIRRKGSSDGLPAIGVPRPVRRANSSPSVCPQHGDEPNSAGRWAVSARRIARSRASAT